MFKLKSKYKNIDIAESAVNNWLSSPSHSFSTQRIYITDIDQATEFFGKSDIDILDISSSDLKKWLDYLETDLQISAATRAKKLAVMKGFVRSLLIEGIFPPERGQAILSMKAPKVSKENKTPVLSQEDARKLLDSPDVNTLRGIRDSAILAVLLFAGVRRSTIVNLKRSDWFIENEKPYLRIHNGKNKNFPLPLHPEAAIKIKTWIDISEEYSNTPDEHLFKPFFRKSFRLENKKMSDFNVWHIVKRYGKKIGLNVNKYGERGICPHSTRATVIASSFDKGARVEEVQHLVGHQDVSNTLRYRKITPQDAENVINKLDY